MKPIKTIISLTLSVLFLKQYNLDEAKKKEIRKRLPYFLSIWGLFVFSFVYGLPNLLGNVPHNIGLLTSLIFFLLFSFFHWFLMINLSRVALNHIAYIILLLPVSVLLIWNLTLWNKPTYFGAMDGFANAMTAQMKITIIAILPTFLFLLRITKVKHQLKGILLLSIVLYSGFMGVKQCIGKEGYLADTTGGVFAFLIVMLVAIAIYLIKFSGNDLKTI